MLGHRHSHALGEGERRARERLAAKRKANAKIPSAEHVTRQQRRRNIILRERQAIMIAKQELARFRKGPPGGTTLIRTVDDIERVLG